MHPPQSPPAYDEVRRKLEELGYLDGPIGRFVLRDVTGGVVRAAAKAALLGGPLLGGLLAGAAVAANRPLLRAIDALVLWLYFGLLAIAALFVLDVIAASATAALARRRGARSGDTLRASLFIALPMLFYLVLLRARRPAGASLGGDVAFLLVAGAATLFVAWLVGLVSLAGIIGRTGSVPDRARRPLISVVIVLLPLVAFGVVARAIATRAEFRGAVSSPFAMDATAQRVIVLGVDGLDGGLVEALEPEGAVEPLLRLFRSGAVFPLRRPSGQEPPQVWTTIATGVPADVHGIRGAGVARLPGVATPLRREGPIPLAVAFRFLLPARIIPASGVARSVLALWEIAALRVRSASIGWWASWPARSGDGTASGYVVSDRVLAKLIAGRDEDYDAAPAALYARLAARFAIDREAIRARFDERFAGIREEAGGRLAWESFLIDAWHLDVARLLLDDPEVRAAFVYLPGLEILRQRLPDSRAGSVQAFGAHRILAAYVRWLTESLAALETGPDSVTTVLVADPGRSAAGATEGFAIVVGSRARPGCVGVPISHLDVAPLTLELMGFPASAEMPGKMPSACLQPPGPSRPRVATFGRKALASHAAGSADDPELLERLRSLGYIR